MSTRPRFFCFSHIPKTAGTTFYTILERQFHGKMHRASHGFYEPRINREQIQWVLDQGTRLRCLAGHSVSADLPYDHIDYNVIGITFLRDPIDRLLSEYFYLRKLGFKNIMNQDWVGFIHHIADNGPTDSFWNSQAKSLQISPKNITSRIEEEKLIVIPQHKYDEGLLLLKHLFPKEFSDISYVSQNINPGRGKGGECPDWFKDKCLAVDYEIYNIACSNFDRQIENCIGSKMDVLRIKHQNSCNQRKVLKQPIKSLFSKINSILEKW